MIRLEEHSPLNLMLKIRLITLEMSGYIFWVGFGLAIFSFNEVPLLISRDLREMFKLHNTVDHRHGCHYGAIYEY